MNITMFTPDDLQNQAIKNKWSKYTVEVIQGIIDKWHGKDSVQSILLFFKGKTLQYYMLIIQLSNSRNKTENYKGDDIPSETGEAKIVGLEPYYIKGKKITDNDGWMVVELARNNSWDGEEIFRISASRNHQEIKTDTPVTQEIIKFGLELINEVEARTGEKPGQLETAVKAMQQEYANKTGNI